MYRLLDGYNHEDVFLSPGSCVPFVSEEGGQSKQIDPKLFAPFLSLLKSADVDVRKSEYSVLLCFCSSACVCSAACNLYGSLFQLHWLNYIADFFCIVSVPQFLLHCFFNVNF